MWRFRNLLMGGRREGTVIYYLCFYCWSWRWTNIYVSPEIKVMKQCTNKSERYAYYKRNVHRQRQPSPTQYIYPRFYVRRGRGAFDVPYSLFYLILLQCDFYYYCWLSNRRQ